MDRTIVLASHGALAEGLADTARMVLGSAASRIRTYSLVPGGTPDAFAQEVRADAEAAPDTEFVVLTDIYGASVCTAMCSLLDLPNVHLFTGMNVAMLLSLMIEHPAPLDPAAAEEIVHAAREGSRLLDREQLAAQQEDEEDF